MPQSLPVNWAFRLSSVAAMQPNYSSMAMPSPSRAPKVTKDIFTRAVLDYDQQQIEVDNLPDVPVKIMMNVGNPDRAFDFANIPNHGVGLARLEFIINRMIGVHPKALLEFDELRPDLKNMIREQMAGYDNPVEFFISRLSEGIGSIAAAFSPLPVIVACPISSRMNTPT